MATAPVSRKLNLTRDQLAQFLTDQQQIRQFELLFSVVDEVQVITGTDFEYQADTAAARANEALASLSALAQDTAVTNAALEAKVQQALDTIPLLAQALDLLVAAPVIQNNNSLATDYIDFNNNAPAPASKIGRLHWNGGYTLNLEMTPNVNQAIGESQFYYIKASAAIAKGQLVMFDGSVGASGVLKGKPSTGITNGQLIMGVAAEAIANNGFGLVSSFGLVRGFDTTGTPYGEVWSDGDILYYNPSFAGGLTKNLPAAPIPRIVAAAVVNASSAGAGSVFVRVQAEPLVSQLSDVYAPTPLAGDVLIYDATQQRWESNRLTAGTNVSIANADGAITINATDAFTGTVTSVAALTLGTTGTDLSSTVANPTTTPVITLNVPTASATNRGALSSTDWSTFNSKQAALVSGTNIKTVGGVTLLGAGDVSAPSFTTVTTSSTTDATTPNAGTTGGFRLRGNATSATAYLQVTDSTASAQWGYASIVASGLWTWSGAFTATTITASTQFSGAGTGLTGTAAGLSVGGNAATATNVAGSGITGSRNIPVATLPAGTVLQVVSATYSTQVSTSSSTYADTGLTATITPTSSTSKILVIVSQSNVAKDTNNTGANIRLLRGASVLSTAAIIAAYNNAVSANNVGSVSLNYLDSPATTSATTYKTQVASNMNSATCYVQTNGSTSYITLMEIAA